MDIASVIAAWVGAAAGVGALVWQIATWRRSKHAVKVVVKVSFPPTWVEVIAVNSGSDPVTVTNWGIGLDTREQAHVTQSGPGTTLLPHRLEGGSEAKFLVLGKDLRRLHDERGVPFSKMHGWVRLATGRRVESRRGLPMKD
ncbi:hypothetical protein [Amnibacterium kyonggiense]|uniref:Uncharacterized protein n=1 Tax=Amnibacterium kyonggiense TaxID=595671 RepID=A0A4R7FMM7_9MICO|nr:hypothetical protein [Amnibacterium kyonggiense]TDS77703.1 hypothetical protein CLV52_2664 [Amnibacterium kyonggiense]